MFAEVIEHDLSPEERKLISLQLQELHNQARYSPGKQHLSCILSSGCCVYQINGFRGQT